MEYAKQGIESGKPSFIYVERIEAQSIMRESAQAIGNVNIIMLI